MVTSGEHSITIPDGNKVQVTHIGIVVVNGVSLQEVLYVPGFKFNLISIPKLCKDLKCEVIFTDNACFLQGHSMRMPLGKLESGLYCTAITSSSVVAAADSPSALSSAHGLSTISTSVLEEVKHQHIRLGHMPFQQPKHLFPSLPINAAVECICQVCPAAR